MWNELESYKHHFLRMELNHLEPVVVSSLVEMEFKAAQSKRDQCQTPREVDHYQCTKSTYLQDRTKLAYGLGALPKLLSELQSDTHWLRWRAINSLSEFLMNPINAQRALRDTEIVRLLKNALIRHQHRFTIELKIEKLLECFRIISYYDNGAREMVKHKTLCDSFYRILLKDPMHDEMAATILRNISEKPAIFLELYENSNSYEQLKEVFHRDICNQKYPYNLWVHLSHFLEIFPEKGIELGFFEFLHTRIVKKYPEYYGMTMKCFAFIVRCENGQRLFDNADCVALLYNIMTDEITPPKSYEFVVMAFLHGLQSKDAMRRCRDFVDLPKIMTKFAFKLNRGNRHFQLYALKALRQLGEMPCIKEYMRVNCEEYLRTMICLSKDNDCERMKLVNWLNRGIFETESDLYT